MGFQDENDMKVSTAHIEYMHNRAPSQELESDIEETRTGKFAWLVSITAAIGGMLFGMYTSSSLPDHIKTCTNHSRQVMILASSVRCSSTLDLL